MSGKKTWFERHCGQRDKVRKRLRAKRFQKHLRDVKDAELVKFHTDIANEIRIKRYGITTYSGDGSNI